MDKRELQKIYDKVIKDKNKLEYVGNGIYAVNSGLSPDEFDKEMKSKGYVRLEDSKWMNTSL